LISVPVLPEVLLQLDARRNGRASARLTARGGGLPVGVKCLLSLEILPEGLVDDLGVGQPVHVSLPPGGILPALLDKEGDAPGLPACIMGVAEHLLALLEPGPHLFHVREQATQLLRLRLLLLFEHFGKWARLRGRGLWRGSAREFLQAVTN